ncbi:MAG TPA: glycosyltransferase family 2 protein, partial [Desulfobulbaceae bacterium]|nr:glycosyltransferase family 2 protein [Desulfobulbaceae bacterium]
LDSIRKEKDDNCRIIVVDNGSVDGSLDLLRADFPEIELIANTENLGFAAANNQAIKQCTEELLFFLNPDTELENGCLKAIRKFMDAHPKVGLAGPAIINRNGSSHPAVEYRYPGSRYCGRQFDDLPGKIAWILGAALVARSSVIGAIGGFDTRFFLYAEDIDLCLAVRKEGWQLAQIPEAKVMHLEGQSEKGAPFAEVVERKVRSDLLFLKKHYDAVTVRKIRRVRLLESWWRICCLRFEGCFLDLTSEKKEKLIRYEVMSKLYRQA